MFTPVYKKEIKELYNHLKGSALKRGIPFSLTVVDLNNLSFPLTCPIFGMPLVFNRNNVEDNSYSVDRIDSSKGYEKDNIVIISQKANRIKTNATLAELRQIVSFYEVLLEQAEFSDSSR
jgi:hypothetical protein